MKAKQLFALLLSVLLLIGLFSACNSTTDTPTDTTEPANETSDTTKPANETTDATEPADESEEPVGEAYMGTRLYSGHEVANFPIVPANQGSGGLTLPLADGDEISVFISFTNSRLSTPADVIGNQVIAEKTGVTVDWQTYSEADQFNIMCASGLYADIIMCQKTTFVGGIDKAIEDEIYTPANNYFEYTPNFVNMLKADRSIDIQSKTDIGNYWFSCIQTGNEPAWCGPMVRTDWVKESGVESFVTYQDWEDVLIYLRDNKGIAGLLPYNTCMDTIGFGLTAGYDTAPTFYAKDGVEARYGFLDDSMYDYLSMMARWYKEGLIYKDFVSLSPWGGSTDPYTNEEIGLLEFSMYSQKPSYDAMVAGDTDSLDAVPYPAVSADQQGNIHFRRYNYIIGDSSAFITTGAVDRGHEILAAQWLDYRYSMDGFAIINYGREGLTWEYGEDGMPHVTDYVLNPTDGRLTSQVMEDTQCSKGGGGFYSWLHAYDQYPEEVSIAYEIWDNSSKGDWIMPGITMTVEESEEYTSKYNDISTYVGEMVLRFVTGDTELNETSWGNFINEIKTMGIEDCVSIYQAALDRYNNR